MGEYPGLQSEFRERFRIVTDPAMLRAERKVIGGDYGASSYTTMNQADDLARCLGLAPGRMLLDLGSGPGVAWKLPCLLDRMHRGAHRSHARRNGSGGRTFTA